MKTNRPLTVAALLLSMFMAATEATVVGTAMPTVIADLGGIHLYGWVSAAYLLTTTISVPVYGKIADVIGRKPVLLFGIAMFLVGSSASGFASTIVMLIVARAAQGLGAGAMQPIALTIIGDIFDMEERGRVQGWFSAVWGIAGIVGPLLGGAIVAVLSWRWVFWINIPFGVMAMVILVRAFAEAPTERKDKPPIDRLGALVLTLGSLALLLGASGEKPWLTVPIGALLLLAFVPIERRAIDPVLPMSLLTERMMSITTISNVLLGAIMSGALTFVPLYAQNVLGGTPTEAGAAVAPMLVGWPISSTIVSRLLTRTGFRTPILLGSLIVGASLAFFAAGMSPETSHRFIQVWMFVLGWGMGMISTSLLIAVQFSVSWGQRGVATATTMFSRSLGGALGTGALGGVLAMRLGEELSPNASILGRALSPIFWIVLAFGLANVLAVAFYPRRSRQASEVSA
jgi:EmrB/QacA subfamily drug resistance transporter